MCTGGRTLKKKELLPDRIHTPRGLTTTSTTWGDTGKRRRIMKKSKTIKQHRHSRKLLLVALGFVVGGGLYLAIHSTQPTEESFKSAQRQGAERAAPSPALQAAPGKVPPYHESAAAARPFPPFPIFAPLRWWRKPINSPARSPRFWPRNLATATATGTATRACSTATPPTTPLADSSASRRSSLPTR